MKTYRKMATVNAIQFDGSHKCAQSIALAFGRTDLRWSNDGVLVIPTLEGDVRAKAGDYICQGAVGENWPIRKDIFENTYVEVT